MCKVTHIIDGACDHYPHHSLSRSCPHGWSYKDNKCRGNRYEVVSSITLEHPFCTQCEREQEDSIRERYAEIERKIIGQGKRDKWLKVDVEVALEVCRRECKGRLAGNRVRSVTSGDAGDTDDSQTSEHDSDGREIVVDTDVAQLQLKRRPRDSERATDDHQNRQDEADDIDMIVDAYFR